MPDQDKINDVTIQIVDIIAKAKLEVTKDLLKLKDTVTPDEFVIALNKMDLKAILDAKISKAKELYISHHKTILEETIPFGDLDADK
jgi:hypothetical protein